MDERARSPTLRCGALLVGKGDHLLNTRPPQLRGCVVLVLNLQAALSAELAHLLDQVAHTLPCDDVVLEVTVVGGNEY